MRKFFTPALESIAPPEVRMLSLEEEMLEVAETTAEVGQIASDLQEVDRVIETSDSLEDLAVVADQIETATPTEVALIETAGAALTAGTDVQPEELVPAMEGFIGKRIATESLRERAKEIWTRIQAFLVEIWKKIEAFFYRVLGDIPRLRKRLQSLEEAVDGLKDKKPEEGKKLSITSGVKNLSVEYKVLSTGADLSKGVKTLELAAKYVYGDYITSLVAMGAVIEKAIADFDPKKAHEAAKDLRQGLAKAASFKSSLPAAASDSARWPGYKSIISRGLMGNKSLATKSWIDNSDTSDLGALDRHRHGGMELVETNERAQESVGKLEIAPLSITDMKSLLKDCLGVLDVLEDYHRGSKAKQVKEAKAKLQTASKKATEAMEKAKEASTEEERAVVPYYTAMLNFNASFAKWAKSPAVDLMNHSVNTIRAVAMVVNLSASAYK